MKEYYIIVDEQGLFYDKYKKEWVSVPSLWLMPTYAKRVWEKLRQNKQCYLRKVTLKIIQ